MVNSKTEGAVEIPTPIKIIDYGEGKSITVSTGAFLKNIESKSFKEKSLKLRDSYVKGVIDKAKKARIGQLFEKELDQLSETELIKLNEAQDKALFHAYRKDFEESDKFTSINLINSFAVKNSSGKVGMEGIFPSNEMTLENAKDISIGSIDVMSTQLSNSLDKLKSLSEKLDVKKEDEVKELKANAKLAGKLAQSLGRLVPTATMGALKNTKAAEAGKISKVLNEIETVCNQVDKIEKMSADKQDILKKSIESLGTSENDKNFVKLIMEGFAKESFKYGGSEAELTAEKLTAEKIGVDLRMNQMIDTIVDLMEDLDKEYGKDYDVKLVASYDSAAEGFKKDVQDTFAKLGLLLKDKKIGVSGVGKEDLAAGFERARKTRNVMENIRNMPMFSEFKYADLNKNLTKTLFEGVLLDHEKNEKIPDGFYKAFEDSKKDLEKDIEYAKINGETDEVERLKGQKTEDIFKKFTEEIKKIKNFNLGGIDVKQAAKLLVAIDAEFDKLVEKTGAFRGGMRGRNREIFNLRFNKATGAFNLQVEDEDGSLIFKKFDEKEGSFSEFKYNKGNGLFEEVNKENKTILSFKYNKENECFVDDKGYRIEDEKNIPGILKEIAKNANDDTSIPEILSEIAKNHTFSHSYQTNVTADHNALKDEWVDIINKPMEFLEKAAENNKDLGNLIIKADKGKLRTAILNTKTGNKVFKGEKLGDLVDLVDLVEVEEDKYKSVRSFAGIIEDNGLRTICGPSGTTTDTIVGMFGMFQKDFIKKALSPLGKLLDTIKHDVKDTEGAVKSIVSKIKSDKDKEFDNLKKIFSSIANYMINGQYHSPGEVLSGLSTAALSFIKYGDEIDQKVVNNEVTNENVRDFAAQADVICRVLGNEENAKWLFPFAKAA